MSEDLLGAVSSNFVQAGRSEREALYEAALVVIPQLLSGQRVSLAQLVFAIGTVFCSMVLADCEFAQLKLQPDFLKALPQALILKCVDKPLLRCGKFRLGPAYAAWP